ncbi:MAG TPA: hypothetical protein PKO36_12880 [Candidatus Hydrogenedentes bacterium]|nr:hypothetical protein [Candidatus Hydrogenedentota bacterium]HOV74990.1 hypothetical protein [Candidatus Hydrogenedentota bacterium]
MDDSAHKAGSPGRAAGRTAAVIALCTLALLGIVEAGSRIAEHWIRPVVADYGLGFTEESRVFVPDPNDANYLITNPVKLLTFHEQRFRLRKDPGVRRIFMVGGSCVLLLQDENGMPFYRRVEEALNVQMETLAFPGFPGPGLSRLRERLEKHFGNGWRFEIVNCGAGSYGSHRLLPVMAEVLNYDPDAILYYEGHNEFEEIEQMRYVPFGTLRIQNLLERLAVYRLMRNYLTTLRSRQLVKPENRRLLVRRWPQLADEKPCRDDYDAGLLGDRMQSLENNLEMMAALCRRRGVPLILSTAPSNLLKPHEFCERDKARYQPVHDLYRQGRYDEARTIAEKVLSEIFRHQASEAENTILRRVAARNELPLADVKAAIIAAEPNHFPGETLFWDDCHFYPRGNEIMLDVFFDAIVENIDFSVSPARLIRR